ncbi:hypothetical protein [Verrucomicrobium sp. BvORR034]|uniref:hypothetical protein n=1 Tax=Verrucomicrobium sp. BvORR034 TaxID=1396418 RepID=UPI0022410461|nr:hypothetical protein [Verrucomicrobium sp. BvORR034]
MIAILEGFPKWTDGKFVFDHITRAKTYNRLEDADFVNGTLIGRLPPAVCHSSQNLSIKLLNAEEFNDEELTRLKVSAQMLRSAGE